MSSCHSLQVRSRFLQIRNCRLCVDQSCRACRFTTSAPMQIFTYFPPSLTRLLFFVFFASFYSNHWFFSPLPMLNSGTRIWCRETNVNVMLLSPGVLLSLNARGQKMYTVVQHVHAILNNVLPDELTLVSLHFTLGRLSKTALFHAVAFSISGLSHGRFLNFTTTKKPNKTIAYCPNMKWPSLLIR